MDSLFTLVDYGLVGIVFATLILIFCLVEKFFKFAKHQEDSFKNTIDNHLDTQATLSREQMEMNRTTTKAVEELLVFLRYHNGRNNKKRK